MKRTSLPADYTHALCQPVTRRVMFLGLPVTCWLAILQLFVQLVHFELYWFAPLYLGLVIQLRRVYARDEWIIGAWFEHARAVLQGTTRLEV